MPPATLPASDARRAYERDGFVVLPGLLSADLIARAIEDAERLFARTDLIATNNLRCRWQNNVHTGECTFETFDPVIDLSPACHDLAFAPVLLGALQDLYDEPAELFKDKLIFK